MSIAGPADSFKFLIRYRNDKFWTALAVAETVDRRILVSPAQVSSTRRSANRSRPTLYVRARPCTGPPRSPRPRTCGRAVGWTGQRGRGVIAGVSVAVARQALIAHEKAGTAARLKGSRTGVPGT
jgi:hypothetical protein